MKAIDKLIELRKTYSNIVAIAMDFNGCIFYYAGVIPELHKYSFSNKTNSFLIEEPIEFDSNNWEECIVTINDLQNYEVKTITISESEYKRLLQAEKTLQNIQNIISKR